jgi:NAD(P)-dependent dehydrogenase (short-subunit alcohol dehydrogenase family)
MTGLLTGRVAAITGGASGLGRATALRFLDEGAMVVIADLNADNGQAVVDEAAAVGYRDELRFVRTDVSQEAHIVALVAAAVDGYGQLDVMFNNAGIGGAFGAITDLDADDWDETFAVLVRGVFLGCKHAARQMRVQGWGGSIVNTASIAGLSGGGGPVAYSAAKAAVINLTRAAAVELAPDHIRVNAVCPGAIDTPLLAQGRRKETADEPRLRFQPWPDHGRADDVAGAVLFLAGDDSHFVTGEALVVDGGLTAAGPAATGMNRTAPEGFVGMNRGTTGQPASIRSRPERPAE